MKKFLENFNNIFDKNNKPHISKRSFVFFLAVGLLVRIIFSSFSFHMGDLMSWKFFGNAVYDWHISPLIWQAQGPLNGLPIIIFQAGNHIGINNSYFLSIGYHMPFIVGDIFLILVSYIICRDFFYKDRYELTLTIWYSSMLIFVSSIWGQSEQWMIAFTLLSFYFIAKGRFGWGGFILGLASAFKYIPIIIFPIILFVHGNIRKFILAGITTVIAFLGSFAVAFFADVIFFKDYGYLRYFLDRSGTIVGNFVPIVGSAFVGTGTSIWGELYNLGLVDGEKLNAWKSYWIIIYALLYLTIISYLFWISKKYSKYLIEKKEKFIFLCIAFVVFIVPFLFLYPQSQIQRFLNFLIPLYFIFFYLKMDLRLLAIINILVIMANDIYARGGLFLFENSNIFLTIYLFISLFLLQFIFIPVTKNKILAPAISIILFAELYYIGGTRLHFLLTFTNYLLLFFVSTIILSSFIKKHEVS